MNIGQYFKLGAGAFVALFIILAGFGSYYTIEPSQYGFVRFFGQTTTSDKDPIGPGTHFKVPFFASVDVLQTSQSTLELPPFEVHTIDNQPVTLTIGVQYKIPPRSVYRLLYNVGRTGSGDIESGMRDIIKDRVSRIFSSTNTITISANREDIQERTQSFVKDALEANFGVELVSLLVPGIAFSPAFNESNAAAVLAKNEAVKEENRILVFQYQAKQRVIQAQGERDQAVATAEGVNQTAILNAEARAKATELQANANATAKLVEAKANAGALDLQSQADKNAATLRGTGDASARKAIIDASGGPAAYTEIVRAEAGKNWNGTVPSLVTSDKAGAMMPLYLPTQAGK